METYLEIELVRFQDQLAFEMHVAPELHQVSIPKFLIQPLIENAIKHGTSKIEKGIIKLEMVREHNDLRISVFDNGPAFPEHTESGYGLKSTVDKLNILYQKDYSFQLINGDQKQVKIVLKNSFS